MPRFATFEIAAAFTLTFGIMTAITAEARAGDLSLRLRYQTESSLDSARFHVLTRGEKWNPEETAVVVCDVWDLHHCLNAVRRLE